MPPVADYYRLAPEIVASVFGIIVMLAEAWTPRRHKGWLGVVALVGAVTALASVFVARAHPGEAFYGLMRVDDFSVFLHLLVFGIAALVILGSRSYLERENIHQGEYYALVLFSAVGMGVMAGGAELVTIFIGLEISSISTYILAGFRRNAPGANEAAMKYFLLGSFATAFFLYGVALVYGATGTTMLAGLGDEVTSPLLMTLGLGLVFVGLAFKVATVPFQIWTPDVYEGAPTPVTALMSSGPKAAAFAVLLRVYMGVDAAGELWFWAIWISAVLTMFVGNLAALVQTSVKRMLAYSSIAHAGYLLVAIAASTAIGTAAVLYYLVAYALMKVGAFTLVAHLSTAGEKNMSLDDYAGLGRRQPAAAALLSLFLLSLLGLPLTAGFLGKFYVFRAAVISGTEQAELLWLVAFAAINTAIGAYYYLRVIIAMYFREPASDWQPLPLPAGLGLVVLLAAAGTILLGVFPGPVIELATLAADSFR
jgi:NADH-quinone oxidoreductase subunit N